MSILMVFLQLWTLALSTNDSNCVGNYIDFEEQTFGNNSKNRMKLYEAFYPPNHHLPYSVVVTYQAALPNGTRVNISTNPNCPDRPVWRWVSSPTKWSLCCTVLVLLIWGSSAFTGHLLLWRW